MENYTKTYKVVRKVTNWDIFHEYFTSARGTVVEGVLEAKVKATKTIKLRPQDPVADLRYLGLRAACLRAQQRLKSKPTDPVRRDEHNRLRAQLQRYSKGLKREQWHEFCTTLNAATLASKVWKVINAMAGAKHSRTALESLMINMYVSPQELGGVLADSLFSKSRHVEPYTPKPHDQQGPLDNLFTPAELDDALRLSNAKSAPGPDGILYSALRNLPDNGKETLLDYYNDIWETGNVPAHGKKLG